MHVLRVFNNNVVLARDDSQGVEVVITGRGVGFQAHQGDAVDESKVAKVFYPADGRDPDHLGEMLSFIPAEHVKLTLEAMRAAGLECAQQNKLTLVIALADHLGGAIRRALNHEVVEYPLRQEVQQLYAEEYRQAQALLDAYNAALPEPLADAEAVALTLHLVNAGFASGDLSYTYTMTGLIEQLIEVVQEHAQQPLDQLSVARFITHLRYLFVRVAQHQQLDDQHSPVGKAIMDSYPEAAGCARRLAALVELRLGEALTNDEVSYLALHVARASMSQ